MKEEKLETISKEKLQLIWLIYSFVDGVTVLDLEVMSDYHYAPARWTGLIQEMIGKNQNYINDMSQSKINMYIQNANSSCYVPASVMQNTSSGMNSILQPVPSINAQSDSNKGSSAGQTKPYANIFKEGDHVILKISKTHNYDVQVIKKKV